jgi:hypothetical protein
MSSKNNCETSTPLSMRFLKSQGYLDGSWRHGWVKWTSSLTGHENSIVVLGSVSDNDPHFRLQYSKTGWDGEKESFDYRVEVTKTSCYFGGYRYWFICPLIRSGVPCRRRVGVLYIGSSYFGCRKCHDLAYHSQQETHSGWRGAFGKILFTGYDEKEAAMRVKYWKGRPTKRYARLLRKMGQADDPVALAMAERSLLSRLRK